MSKKNRASARRGSRKKLWITLAVLAVIAIVAVSYFTSPGFQRTKTVGTVGEDKITEAEFAYFYQTTVTSLYSEIQNTYGDYASLILDTSKPLDEQNYDENQTWHEYAVDRTLEGIQEIHALYHAAQEDGYQLSEEGRATIDSTAESVKSAAASVGYTTSLYLRAVYGHGMNLKTYTNLLEMVLLAEGYSTWKESTFTYTDSQIDDYYNAHKTEYDTVDLRMIPIQGETKEDSDAVDLTEAKAIASHVMNECKTEEEFAAFAVDISDDDDIETEDDTLYSYLQASTMSPEGMSEWCYDEARQYGDMNVFTTESACYVVFYLDRHDVDYNLVSMRHILVKPDQEEDGSVSDEAAEAAIEKTDGYLKEWEASDGTEETFAAMANAYSDDTGSNTSGGLYSGIYKGQMVKPVNDWLFDPERQTGDVTIVQSSFGYHLMYFAGTGENYKTSKVSEDMRTADFGSWLEGVKAAAPLSVKENVGSVVL